MKKFLSFLFIFILLVEGIIFAAKYQAELLEVKDPGFVKLGGYKKPAVYFSHDLHASLYKVKCTYCHHHDIKLKNTPDKDQLVKPCSACHGKDRRELLLSYHNLCFSCHKRIKELDPVEADAPVYQCNRCHLPNPEAIEAEEKRIAGKIKHRSKKLLEIISKMERGGVYIFK